MPKIPEKVLRLQQPTTDTNVTTTRFFNEIIPYAAQWLENLFPNSFVERKSIVDVVPDQVCGFDRVHLFAGIGGWEYALQLARFPNDEVVWTGSCPCQPFSVAGKQKGTNDERHLWPEMYRLISECTPPTIFGEQVAGQLGLEWFDGVCTDLEKSGYAVASVVVPACGVGAPHRRDRIYWVAYTPNTSNEDRRVKRRSRKGSQGESGRGGPPLPNSDSNDIGRVGNADSIEPSNTLEGTIGETEQQRDNTECGDRGRTSEPARAGIDKPWDRSIWIDCADGKRRRIPPIEQGILPLAPRLPRDVEQIGAYGNAIVPQLAAVFIKSFLEARQDLDSK